MIDYNTIACKCQWHIYRIWSFSSFDQLFIFKKFKFLPNKCLKYEIVWQSNSLTWGVKGCEWSQYTCFHICQWHFIGSVGSLSSFQQLLFSRNARFLPKIFQITHCMRVKQLDIWWKCGKWLQYTCLQMTMAYLSDLESFSKFSAIYLF